jgi:hypothetical protein
MMRAKKSFLLYSYLWIQSLIFFYMAYKRNKDRKIMIIHFFTLTGLAYLFEYIVLVLLKAYRYYPKFFKRIYFDNILGSSISQFFTVPTIATFMTKFNLNVHWKLFFSVYLMITEIIFKKLKIYKQFWWKTIYTGFFTFTFFLFSDYLYKSLSRIEDKPLLKAITVFMKSFTLYSTYMFYLAVLLKAYFFKVPWFNDGARGHTAFATLYSLFISMLYTAIFVLRKKWLMVASVITLFSLDAFLVKIKVLKFKNEFNIIRNNVQRILVLSLFFMLDVQLYKKKTANQEETVTTSQPNAVVNDHY